MHLHLLSANWGCVLDRMEPEKGLVEEPAAIIDQIHRQHRCPSPGITAQTPPSMYYAIGVGTPLRC